MKNEIRYVLVYRKAEEFIKVDNFESVYDALDYCVREDIEEPVSVSRVEIIEEKIFNSSQLRQLLHKQEPGI